MQKKLPKISVVTPNFNQVEFLEATIHSVLSQQYPNLEYIIIDGGSTDGSKDLIASYDSQLAYWVSEPDEGMYHAIQKGFEQSTGEIMCWINSDDVLWEDSLHYVAKTIMENPHMRWLQGYPSVIDTRGNLLYQRAPVGSKAHFLSGTYRDTLEFIQQESTFWTRSLWERSNGLNRSYRLAADFDLWLQFFQFETLYCSRTQLAAFRKREGQQSQDMDAYLEEASQSLALHRKALTIKNSWWKRWVPALQHKPETIHWID